MYDFIYINKYEYIYVKRENMVALADLSEGLWEAREC
jgi:hypothetical protein